jgi:hypothetical protein
MSTVRIMARHVGRPVDFKAAGDGATLNGRIEKVAFGIATIRYWTVRDRQGNLLAHNPGEGFVAYLEVRSPRIVAVH